MPNTFLTGCIDQCAAGSVATPAIPVAQSCTAEDTVFSQVCRVILIPDSMDVDAVLTAAGETPPLDPTNIAHWSAIIDNTNTDGTRAKELVVEGGVDEPDTTEVELPKRQTKVASRLYTMTVTRRFLDDQTYEFFRALQCGDTQYKIFYETVGDRLFGFVDNTTNPNDYGIDISSQFPSMPLGSGRDDLELVNWVITWDADGDPDRWDSVFT